MKITVFDPSHEPDPELFLSLSQVEPDRIDLVAVDGNGESVSGGHLLRITSDGFKRIGGVSNVPMFPLDGNGRVTLCDE